MRYSFAGLLKHAMSTFFFFFLHAALSATSDTRSRYPSSGENKFWQGCSDTPDVDVQVLETRISGESLDARESSYFLYADDEY